MQEAKIVTLSIRCWWLTCISMKRTSRHAHRQQIGVCVRTYKEMHAQKDEHESQ